MIFYSTHPLDSNLGDPLALFCTRLLVISKTHWKATIFFRIPFKVNPFFFIRKIILLLLTWRQNTFRQSSIRTLTCMSNPWLTDGRCSGTQAVHYVRLYYLWKSWLPAKTGSATRKSNASYYFMTDIIPLLPLHKLYTPGYKIGGYNCSTNCTINLTISARLWVFWRGCALELALQKRY